MNSLEQALKNLAINGKVDLVKAINLIKPIDTERSNTVILLKKCEKQVGTILGEDINKHMAGMNGTKFNSVEYHYESMPNDQRQ